MALRRRKWSAYDSGEDDSSGIALSPEQQNSLLQQAYAAGTTGAGFVADTLDTPGAMVRGAISAGMKGEDPLSAAASAFHQTSSERVNGRDLLRQAGLVGDQDNWGNFIGGLATEIALDPLAWLSGPAKALSPAGKVASKAGLLDDAAATLSRHIVQGGDGVAPELVSRAAAAGQKLGRDSISATEAIGRPLLGKRATLRHGTLQNLIDAADNPEVARQNVINALGNNSTSEAALERLKDQSLGRHFGLGVPLMDPLVSFNVPGGGRVGDALDSLMGGARWSALGRGYHALTDNAVGGAFDARSQAVTAGAYRAREAAKADARRMSTYQGAKLFQEAPDAFSEQGNRALGRLIENPKDNAFKAQDDLFSSAHPAVRQYIDWWHNIARESPEQMRQAGLQGTVFDDPHVTGYLPRQTDNLIEQAAARDKGLGRVLSTITSDQLHRSPELQVPGGRDTIAFRLSRDPVVAGAKRTAATDQQAAQHIVDTVFGGNAQSAGQAMELARLLHKLPATVVDPILGSPLYGQHPTSTISRYIEGRAGAAATADALYDALATSATDSPASLAAGGRHLKISEALARMGLGTTANGAEEVGARTQLRQRLAERFGLNPDAVELSKFSVPEDDVIRLTRSKEAFDQPEMAQQLTGLMNTVTRHWAAGILAWPSRIVRDLYGGMYANFLAGALDPQAIPFVKHFWPQLSGPQYVGARQLTQRSAFDPQFIKFLQSMPAYRDVPVDDVAARFYGDLAAGGMLGRDAYTDAGLAAVEGGVKNSLVGVEPERFLFGKGGAMRELGGDWSPGALIDISRNPIARANTKAGQLSDKITRLTGYISLLRQGVSPEEAARRMQKVHVDYGSLTPAERYLRDRFLPFYAFQSRSFREMLRQMAERPGGRAGQTLRVMQRVQDPNGDAQTPESVRQGFGAPIPEDSLFGIPAELGTRYLSGVDLQPYSAAQIIDPHSARNTVLGVTKMLNPMLRVGVEALTGEDIANRQPINATTRSYGPIGKLMRAATGDQSSGSGMGVTYADKLLDILPYVGRPSRFAAQLYDTDAGLSMPSKGVAAAVNALGGVRFKDMPQKAIDSDRVRQLQKFASPFTQGIEVPFIPEDQKSRVPMDAQMALELARKLQRESRDQRRQLQP